MNCTGTVAAPELELELEVDVAATSFPAIVGTTVIVTSFTGFAIDTDPVGTTRVKFDDPQIGLAVASGRTGEEEVADHPETSETGMITVYGFSVTLATLTIGAGVAITSL